MRNRQESLLLAVFVLVGGFLSLLFLLSVLRGEGAATTDGDVTSSVVGQPLAQGSPTGNVAAPNGTLAASAMVVVPAGLLANMAAPPGSGTEEPDVFVAAFDIGRTEVTNAAFAEFVHRTGYVTLAEQAGDPRSWRTMARPDTEAHPVRFIAWADANAYCVDAGLRLPTELEWERAARGDDARLWPWGNEWDGSRVNSLERAGTGPSPVGSYPLGASPYGLMDMAGNVWEWTSSPYLTDATPSPPDAQSAETFRGHLVLRGGSWRTMAAGTQATYRKAAPPEYRRDTTGFRCAGEPTAVEAGAVRRRGACLLLPSNVVRQPWWPTRASRWRTRLWPCGPQEQQSSSPTRRAWAAGRVRSDSAVLPGGRHEA